MTTEVANLIFEADSSALVTAEQRLEQVNRTGARTQTVAKATAGQFRVMKGATQQLGFQIQDVAVQLAAGQNAMMVMGQQGSQIASIFGPGGAVIGALIAIGAAVGVSLAPALFKGEKATEALEKALDSLNESVDESKTGILGLTDELRKLAQANRVAAAASITESLYEARDAMDAAKSSIIENAKESGVFSAAFASLIAQVEKGERPVTDLTDAYDNFFIAQSNSGDKYREFRKELSELGAGFTEAERKVGFLESALADLDSVSAFDPDEAENNIKNIERIIATLEAQADAIRENSDSTAYYKAQALGATQADLERIGALEKTINDLKLLKQDEEELAKFRTELASDVLRIERETNQKRIAIEEEYQLRATQLRLAYEEGVIATKEQYAELQVAIERDKNEKILQDDMRRQSQQMALQQASLQAASSFGSELSSILSQSAEENSAAAKAGYAIAQAIQVAQAINSANVAYAGVIASAATIPDPTGATLAAGIARAEIIRGLGYATAAIIAGNAVGTLAGRAQGGQVRPGQAYRVGEFGPETLVMGSNGGTVTPASNDGVKLDLVTNVKVVGGDDAKVTNTTRQTGDRKFVQDIVVELMSNQSSPARQGLHNTSNVKPRGTR